MATSSCEDFFKSALEISNPSFQKVISALETAWKDGRNRFTCLMMILSPPPPSSSYLNLPLRFSLQAANP